MGLGIDFQSVRISMVKHPTSTFVAQWVLLRSCNYQFLQ